MQKKTCHDNTNGDIYLKSSNNIWDTYVYSIYRRLYLILMTLIKPSKYEENISFFEKKIF